MSKPVPLLRAASLSDLPGVVHGFTTRFDGDGGRLDLGRDTSELLWARIARDLGAGSAPVARLHQVHGNAVRVVSVGGGAGEGDALVTREPQLVLAVRTADCVPILLTLGDPVHAVAAVHSGWRSTALDIIGETVRVLRSFAPTGPIRAVVGPAISGARYEVGEEVVDGIHATGVPHACFVTRHPGRPRPFADVCAAVRWQLAHHGVEQVETISRCTFDDPSLWSHRRDGLARGSLAALIAMVPQ